MQSKKEIKLQKYTKQKQTVPDWQNARESFNHSKAGKQEFILEQGSHAKQFLLIG